MILRLSLDLPDDMTFVRATQLLSRCLLHDMRVQSHLIDDVETIVGELCSNVIRHAQLKAGHFLMTLEFYKSQVVITVIDKGTGFVAEDVLPPATLRPDGIGGQRYGGLGMSMLNGLSDRIDFSTSDPHGTTVRVEKVLHYETEEDAGKAAERDAASHDG